LWTNAQRKCNAYSCSSSHASKHIRQRAKEKKKIIDTKAFSPWPAPGSMPKRRSNPTSQMKFRRKSNLSPAHHPKYAQEGNKGNLVAECSLWVEARGIIVNEEETFKTRFRKGPAANARLARLSMHRD